MAQKRGESKSHAFDMTKLNMISLGNNKEEKYELALLDNQ
jgi:hypothetical protein